MRLVLLALAALILFTGCDKTASDRSDAVVKDAGQVADDRVDLQLALDNVKAAQVKLAHAKTPEAKAAAQAEIDEFAPIAAAADKKLKHDDGVREEERRQQAITSKEQEDARARWYLRILGAVAAVLGGVLLWEGMNKLGGALLAAGAGFGACAYFVGREWVLVILIAGCLGVPAVYGWARKKLKDEKATVQAKLADAEHFAEGVVAKVPIELQTFSHRAQNWFSNFWYRLHGDNHDHGELANGSYGSQTPPAPPFNANENTNLPGQAAATPTNLAK
jgi:hypothetical protein